VSEQVKINLGSGHWKFDGWVNVDLDRASLPEVCADLGFALPIQDGVADLMHSEDFIDQLELNQARQFLSECHRILKPGGVLRTLTPDLERLAYLYLHEQERLKSLWNDHVGVPLQIGTVGEIFNIGMRFAGHTFLYDAETFMLLAAECGFEARRVEFQHSDIPELRGLDLRSPDNAVSLYFDCYKVRDEV
jgi:predicted SAM-dependent methyltransferase